MTGSGRFTNGMNVSLQFHDRANPRNDRSLPKKRNVFPDPDCLALRAFSLPCANSFVTVHFVNQSTRKVPSAWNGSTIAPHLYGVLEFQYLDAVYRVSSHGNNHNPVQPKGFYRRGSLQTHRHLPGAPAEAPRDSAISGFCGGRPMRHRRPESKPVGGATPTPISWWSPCSTRVASTNTRAVPLAGTIKLFIYCSLRAFRSALVEARRARSIFSILGLGTA